MKAVDCCDGFVLDSGCYLLQYVLAAMSTFLAVGVMKMARFIGELYRFDNAPKITCATNVAQGSRTYHTITDCKYKSKHRQSPAGWHVSFMFHYVVFAVCLHCVGGFRFLSSCYWQR